MGVVDNIRPYAPGLRKFLLVILCLQSVAASLMVNSVVAISLLLTFTAFLVRIYRVDPEPVLLLMLHTVISGCMLYDVTSTLCVIVAGMTSLICLGGYEVHGERVAVLVISTLITAILGKPLAIIACVVVGVVIVVAKLRPLRPPMLLLVALSFIALTLLVNRAAGSVLVFVLMGIITALFVVNKVSSDDDLPPRTSTRSHHNSGNNNSNHSGQHSPVPNGYLQLSNPTESLDLHGHTVTGAMKVLHTFLRENEEDIQSPGKLLGLSK
ncbi:uncharacterized protein LOC101851376 isoform X2 [Aplysia californica]|uniref:Uncharacterized protein LOC101851376 isoform X2 n=1 Tax=Aplysia californica TaxID=6500 RepID=A0ABM1W2B7_APLCA|nr:uncharacterized protein LOC101851376 isoform X2 [Aplysia californica]